jgi:hypothetical protein
LQSKSGGISQEPAVPFFDENSRNLGYRRKTKDELKEIFY